MNYCKLLWTKVYKKVNKTYSTFLTPKRKKETFLYTSSFMTTRRLLPLYVLETLTKCLPCSDSIRGRESEGASCSSTMASASARAGTGSLSLPRRRHVFFCFFFVFFMQTACGEQSGHWRLQPTFETNHGRGAPSVNEAADTPVRAGVTSRLEAALTQRAVAGAAEGNQSLVSEVTVKGAAASQNYTTASAVKVKLAGAQ